MKESGGIPCFCCPLFGQFKDSGCLVVQVCGFDFVLGGIVISEWEGLFNDVCMFDDVMILEVCEWMGKEVG